MFLGASLAADSFGVAVRAAKQVSEACLGRRPSNSDHDLPCAVVGAGAPGARSAAPGAAAEAWAQARWWHMRGGKLCGAAAPDGCWSAACRVNVAAAGSGAF
eukprot:COSAG02_NODE_1613_length_11675_cov_8.562716_6_plen_102_part_00